MGRPGRDRWVDTGEQRIGQGIDEDANIGAVLVRHRRFVQALTTHDDAQM
jgi:hypothetical protein